MARQCGICVSVSRSEIEAAVVAGGSLRDSFPEFPRVNCNSTTDQSSASPISQPATSSVESKLAGASYSTDRRETKGLLPEMKAASLIAAGETRCTSVTSVDLDDAAMTADGSSMRKLPLKRGRVYRVLCRTPSGTGSDNWYVRNNRIIWRGTISMKTDWDEID